jgi:hypothetical protein
MFSTEIPSKKLISCLILVSSQLKLLNCNLILAKLFKFNANLDIPLSSHPTNELPHISSTPDDVPLKIDIYSCCRNYQLGKL